MAHLQQQRLSVEEAEALYHALVTERDAVAALETQLSVEHEQALAADSRYD